jgi:hypothetical protein
LSNLYLKTIILPRQARDKHRKSWEQEALFAGNHVSDRAIVATLVEGAQTWGGGPHLVCAAGATHAPPDKTINWSNDQLVKLTINRRRPNPFSALLQTNGKGTISAKGRVDHRIVGDVKVRKKRQKTAKNGFFLTLWSDHILQTIALPRQARDKHRENSFQRRAVFSCRSSSARWSLSRATPRAGAKNGIFFECFPYVCPEPVLVKWSFFRRRTRLGSAGSDEDDDDDPNESQPFTFEVPLRKNEPSRFLAHILWNKLINIYQDRLGTIKRGKALENNDAIFSLLQIGSHADIWELGGGQRIDSSGADLSSFCGWNFFHVFVPSLIDCRALLRFCFVSFLQLSCARAARLRLKSGRAASIRRSPSRHAAPWTFGCKVLPRAF